MLRVKGLHCVVSLLRCMVEWSTEHYIDPAGTGLNAVREFRDEPQPEREGEEGEGEEVPGRAGRGSSFASLRSAVDGSGGGGEGESLSGSVASMDNPEQIESRKLIKQTVQQGVRL